MPQGIGMIQDRTSDVHYLIACIMLERILLSDKRNMLLALQVTVNKTSMNEYFPIVSHLSLVGFDARRPFKHIRYTVQGGQRALCTTR
jgi:hypothetical protein